MSAAPGAARFDFAGRSVLVTGAARGIGRACAEALAAAGAHVVAADRLDCDETVAAIRAGGGSAASAAVDVADEASVVDLFASHLGERRLDCLVHAAGIIHEAPLAATTARDFDRVIAVNLRGSFLVGREALRLMERAGSGRVVMVASDLAHAGRATFSAYVASKHAVLGLVRSWALEFAPAVNVNALCPGPVDTAMLDAAHMSPEWRARELAIPLARFGRPEEIARVVAFLCGPGGDFVTGQAIGVNGGSVMS